MWKHILVFLSLGIFYVLIDFAVFDFPYSIDDDHTFIQLVKENPSYAAHKTASLNGNQLIKHLNSFRKLGRTAHTTHVYSYVRAIIFPLNANNNHVFILFTGIITAFLAYLFIFKLTQNFWLSVWGALIFLSGPWHEIWVRLNTSEAPGTLLLLASLLCLISFIQKPNKKIYFWLSFFLIFIMALTKESFMVLYPSLALLYLSFKYGPSLLLKPFQILRLEIKPLFILFILPFSLGIVLMVYSIKSAGHIYSYGFNQSPLQIVLNNTWWFVKPGVFLLPAILFAVFLAFKDKNARYFLLCVIICLSVFIFQLLVYFKSNITVSQVRYTLPGGLAILTAGICALHLLYKLNNKILYRITLALGILFILKNSKINYVNTAMARAKAESFQKLNDFITQSSPDTLCYIDGYEFEYSSKIQLDYRNSSSKLAFTNTADTLNDFGKELLTSLQKEFIYIPKDSLYSICPEMLVRTSPDQDQNWKWYPDKNKYQKASISSAFNNFSLNKNNILKPATWFKQNDSVSFTYYIRIKN